MKMLGKTFRVFKKVNATKCELNWIVIVVSFKTFNGLNATQNGQVCNCVLMWVQRDTVLQASVSSWQLHGLAERWNTHHWWHPLTLQSNYWELANQKTGLWEQVVVGWLTALWINSFQPESQFAKKKLIKIETCLAAPANTDLLIAFWTFCTW